MNEHAKDNRFDELIFPKKIPGENIGEFSTSPKYTDGLTKREYFAGLAMQGLLANSYSDGANQPLSTASGKQIAEIAVTQANFLIVELSKEPSHE